MKLSISIHIMDSIEREAIFKKRHLFRVHNKPDVTRMAAKEVEQ